MRKAEAEALIHMVTYGYWESVLEESLMGNHALRERGTALYSVYGQELRRVGQT